MKHASRVWMLALAALTFVSQARAEEFVVTSLEAPVVDNFDDSVITPCGGHANSCPVCDHQPWSVGAEALLLKLHSTIGTRQADVFDYDPAYRISIAYTGVENAGVRALYFDYDHDGVDNPGFGRIFLQTYNADLEFFKRFEMGDKSGLEFSGGVRYNENKFLLGVGNNNDFNGFGGTLGLRGTTAIGRNGLLYARGKFALLGGDADHDANSQPVRNFNQATRNQIEVAIGYQRTVEFDHWTMIGHIGGEWQSWQGYNIDPVDEHPESDLFLGGFTAGLTITF